jgi:hypothetical protein
MTRSASHRIIATMTDLASGWSDAGLLNPAIRHPAIDSAVG